MNAYEKESMFPNERNFFFEISSINGVGMGPEEQDQPTRYPYHQIVWITRGSGYYYIDMEKYVVADNSVYLIPPGRVRQFRDIEAIAGHVLSFNTDFLYLSTDGPGRPFFTEVVADFNKVNMLRIDTDYAGLEKLIQEMAGEVDKYLPLRLEVLSGLMKLFLVNLKRSSTAVRQQVASSSKMKIFNSFHHSLEKYFMTKRQVADYASELSVTPGYLTGVIKEVTGYSASYHIQQRMVQEAKRMAMYSDASLKMIAYTLGFDDLSHFSKFFKHAAGMSFSEFKKRNYLRQVI